MPADIVVPVLKPADWEGQGACACRRLSGSQDPRHLPWVAFGYDRPAFFDFLKKEELAPWGGSIRNLEKDALKNLRRQRCGWEEDSFEVTGNVSLRLLICGDDLLAAEHILDEKFMKKAQKHLKAKLLAVGIPRRGVLFMTDGVQDERALAAFGQVVSTQYHRAESAPITPGVFGLDGGEIVGMMQGMEETGRVIVEEEQQDGEELSVFKMVVTQKETGLEEIQLVCAGDDFAQVLQSLQHAATDTLNEALPKPSFSGVIRCWIVTDNPSARNPAVRSALDEIEENLRESFVGSGARTASGHTVRVHIEVGDPST